MVSIQSIVLLLALILGASSCSAGSNGTFHLHLVGEVQDAITHKTRPNLTISMWAEINAPVLPECLNDPMSCFMNKTMPQPNFSTDDQGRFDVVIELNDNIDVIDLRARWAFNYRIICEDWRPKHQINLELEELQKVTAPIYLDCDGNEIKQ